MEIDHGMAREDDSMRRVGRGLLRAVAILLVLAAGGPVSSALAEPPSVTIDALVAKTAETPKLITGHAGTAEGDASTVSVKISGGQAAGESVPVDQLTGEWTYSPPHLADGFYIVEATQRNEAGEEGLAEPRTFTLDSTAPKVGINAVPPVTKVGPLTLAGAAGAEEGDQGVSVTIYQGSSVGGTVVASGGASVSGATWSYSASHLVNGTYTAQATQEDWVGNVGHAATTFKVEVEAPKVTINPVASPTIEARPTLKGTAGIAEGDIRTVSLTLKAVTLKGEKCVFKETPTSVPVGAGGEWEYHAGPLCDGTYSASATQKNEAESTGKSEPVAFEVNTPVPQVTLSTSAFVMRGAESEFVTGATPSFTGTAATGPEDGKSVTVNIYEGRTTTGTPVKATGTVSGGTWTIGPVTALKGGTYTAQVTQEDEAKNVGKSEPPVTFTVDASPPAVTLNEPANKQEFHISNPPFGGSAGTATGDLPLVILKIYKGASATGTPMQTLPITPTGKAWKELAGPRFPNGTYTVRAEQADDVGNIGLSSAATFTIATNAPSPTLTTLGLLARGATLFSSPSPNFSGTAGNAPEDSSTVSVNVYSGTSASEHNLVRRVEGVRSGTSWAAGPVASLPGGIYTAQAEQTALPPDVTGFSETSTFTVDATAPQLTMASPANGSSTTSGSQLVTGSAGTAEGDLPAVTVQLFSGSGIAGTPLQSINVNVVGGAWSATVAGLSPGTYTVRAEQSDDVGNVGFSPTATFAVSAAQNISHSPVASFSWVPSAPHTGERISLLSSSTDAASPITGFSWDLAGNGAFTVGAPVMSTSFSTPGKHLVQLRVTDASGVSSLAAETIPVTAPPIPLMRPFPIVRIVATYSASAVKLRLLSVQASGGARISVSCKGHGCPVKSQTRVAAAGKVGKAPVVFRRFERSLQAGVILEVRVSKLGQIGKYTRFTIRRGRLPARIDSCLSPAGSKPIACPSS